MFKARAVVNSYVLGSESTNMLFSMLPAGEVVIASFDTMSASFHAIS